MAKRPSHARRTRNPSPHGYGYNDQGLPWSEYGSWPWLQLPGTVQLNPSGGVPGWIWAALAAGAIYLVVKRPNIPGTTVDDWIYGHLPSGTPVASSGGTTGSVSSTGAVTPGFSGVTITGA